MGLGQAEPRWGGRKGGGDDRQACGELGSWLASVGSMHGKDRVGTPQQQQPSSYQAISGLQQRLETG
jgi:hypothetical protein